MEGNAGTSETEVGEMKKRFKLCIPDSGYPYLCSAGSENFANCLGYIQTVQSIPENSRQVAIGGGQVVTEVIRPARVKFTLDTDITIECPIEAVER